jgi:parvulin-like peptidyl-prolyl isomerase
MTKPKAERAKEEEAKSLRAERRAAERRAVRRPERTRTARRTDAEGWNRRLIIGGVVAVIVLAVGVIGFGWYQTQIKPLDKTVLRVGDTKFSLAHLERRMKLEREDNPLFAQGGQQLLQLPDIALQQLEREARLLEGADELNVTVSEEEVIEEIRQRGNLADAVVEDLFAQEFRRQVEESGLRENEYRQMLRAQLLDEKVRNYFVYLAPEKEPQVRANWMVADDEDRAEEALQRLEAGEDFALVAQELSLGTGSPGQGVLDWAPRGIAFFLPDDLKDFLFEAEPGERSEIVPSGNLFYIVELLEREDDRPLDGQQREQVGNRDMGEWLVGLDVEIERDLTEEDALRALEDVL